MNIESIFKTINDNGGITLDPLTEQEALTFRFVASYNGYEIAVQFDPDNPSLDDHKRLVDAFNATREKALELGAFVGVWVECPGLWVFDISTSFARLLPALRFAAENQQRAIYDTRLNQTVNVPHGDYIALIRFARHYRDHYDDHPFGNRESVIGKGI